MKKITRNKVNKEYITTKVALKKAALKMDIESALLLKNKMNDLKHILGSFTDNSEQSTERIAELFKQYDCLRDL